MIVATGFDLYEVQKKEEWGYGVYDNIITGLQFERLINASGPTGGKLIRPSDGQKPHNVAFVLCAGSRDQDANPYCSRVCCMYSLKHAHQIMEKMPGTIPYIFYMDIRAFGKAYEEFYYVYRTRARSSSEAGSPRSRKTRPTRTSSYRLRTRCSEHRSSWRPTWSSSQMRSYRRQRPSISGTS